MALEYAKTFSTGRSDDWARLDLGCLNRIRAAGSGSTETRTRLASTCYADTLSAHRSLLLDKSEPGILGPNSRGQGFGLISERHRHAGLWKTYPPAVFFSPAIDPQPLPIIEFRSVAPTQPITLVQGNAAPITVGGTLVELSITYPDRAVINEALPDAPKILTTSYGMNATDDSLQPTTRGHFLLGSARWWTRSLAGERYQAWITRAESSTDRQEKRSTRTTLK